MAIEMKNELGTKKTATPFFSIIIPVYNVASYLRECLDSVLAQTFTDWECLCVDDGSTDDSGFILDEYAQKDPRFRIFHKKNGGVSSARNLALDNVRGKYIAFLDGDDRLNISLLAEMARIIVVEDADFIRFKFTRDMNASDEVGETYKRISSDSEIKAWSIRNLTKGGYCCLSILKIEVCGRFPLGIKYAEDSLFMLEMATKVKKVVLSDIVGYHYRDVPTSAMKKRFSSEERVLFFKEFKRIVSLYNQQSIMWSWMGWFNLCNWCNKPKDWRHATELHSEFKQLVAERVIRLKHIPIYAKPAFIVYVMTGLIFPISTTYTCIRCLVGLRDKLLSR